MIALQYQNGSVISYNIFVHENDKKNSQVL